MIIEQIELEAVGPFRQRVSIGPFINGLNVVAAPNESGKSTLLTAAGATLLERHSSRVAHIRLLQPVGTRLAPTIRLIFHHKGVRYRVEKRFLAQPDARVYRFERDRWQIIAKADAADQLIIELLGLDAKAGKHDPAREGLLRYLWSRQDTLPDWPQFTDQLITQLHRLEPRVHTDRLAELVRREATAIWQESFTPSLLRERNQLAMLGRRISELEERLRLLEERRAQVEESRSRYVKLIDRLTALQTRLRQVQQRRERLLEIKNTVAELKPQLEAAAARKESALSRLHRVRKDMERLTVLHTTRSTLQQELDQIKGELRPLTARVQSVQQALTQHEQTMQAERQLAFGIEETIRRLTKQLELLRLVRERDQLTARIQSLRSIHRRLNQIQEELNRLPPVTEQTIAQAHELEQGLARVKAQLEARGLHIEFEPEHPARIGVSIPGQPARTIHVAPGEPAQLRLPTGHVVLELEGWGRLNIKTGASEISQLLARQQELDHRLRDLLRSCGVENVAQLVERHRVRDRLIREVQALREQERMLLGQEADPDRLHSALEELHKRIRAMHHELGDTPQTVAQVQEQLRASEEELTRVRQRLIQLENQIGVLRAEHSALIARMAQLRTRDAELQARLQALAEEEQQLLARYPQGPAAASEESEREYLAAELQFQAVQKQLPPDYERALSELSALEPEHERLVHEIELLKQESFQLKGSIESLAGPELHRERQRLVSELMQLKAQRTALWRRAAGALLLCRLIELHEQEQYKALKETLSKRLTTLFSRMTGRDDRRVFLTEELAVAGVGVSETELIPFSSLSRGAREQLLLALRLAVADAVAEEEPHCLILDDALAFTDPERERQIKQLLVDYAKRFQIILLTCRTDRYAGLGHSVILRHSAAAQQDRFER